MVRPEEDNDDRYYSMTVRPDKRTALISVRKHEYGIVSNYLARTEIQDRLTVSFQHNHSFHFPENAHQVIMICNGTGIAPFIGMIEANRFKVPITLFWGGRNEDSWK